MLLLSWHVVDLGGQGRIVLDLRWFVGLGRGCLRLLLLLLLRWSLLAGSHLHLLHRGHHHHGLLLGLHASHNHWLHTAHHHRLLDRHHWLHHHRLLIAHRHHLLRGHILDLIADLLSHLGRSDLRGFPLATEVDLPALFAAILDDEPVVEAAVGAEGRDLDFGGTDQVTRSHVLIKHGHCHVISNILDIDVKHLLPLGRLTRTLQRASPHFLLSCLNLRPRVHLTEPFRVSRQLRLDHVQAKHA